MTPTIPQFTPKQLRVKALACLFASPPPKLALFDTVKGWRPEAVGWRDGSRLAACGLDAATANWLRLTRLPDRWFLPHVPQVPIGFVLRASVIRFLSLFRVSSFVLRISRGHQDPGELASFPTATPIPSPKTRKLASFDTPGTSAATRQAGKLGLFDTVRAEGEGWRLQAGGIPPASGLRPLASTLPGRQIGFVFHPALRCQPKNSENWLCLTQRPPAPHGFGSVVDVCPESCDFCFARHRLLPLASYRGRVAFVFHIPEHTRSVNENCGHTETFPGHAPIIRVPFGHRRTWS